VNGAQRIRLELSPVGRIALLLALGASAAAAFEPGLARPLAALAWSLLGLGAWLARRRLVGLELEPARPARATVGVRVELRARLNARRARSGAWTLALCARAGETPQPAARVTGTLGPEPADLALAWRVRRRGHESALVAELATLDPLGLVRARRSLTLACDVLGLPRRGELLADLAHAAARTAPARGRHARGDEELVAVRDWRPGESLRRLHWRLSARRGRAILRELAAPAEGELELVLDTALDEPARRARRAAFEEAVSLTATLAEHHLRAGRRVSLRLGSAVSARALRGRHGLMRARTLLARVEPESAAEVLAPRPKARDFRIVVRAGRGRAAPAESAGTRVLDVDARPGEPHHAPWRARSVHAEELR